MTRIPKLGGGGRGVARQGARPTSRFQTESAAGKALAGVGRQLRGQASNITAPLQELEAKRRKAEITDFGDTKSFEFRKRLQDFTQQKRQELEGTDYSGFQSSVEEFIEEEQLRITGDVEDSEKVEYFNDKVRGTVEKVILNSSATENEKRAGFYTSKRLERAQQFTTSAANNPNPFEANEELKVFDKETEAQSGVLFSPKNVDILKEAARENTRTGMVFGLVRDGLPGIVSEDMTEEEGKEAIQNFLSGKVEGTEEIFKNMDPKERVRYEKQMLRGLQNKKTTQVREVREAVKNAVNLYEKEENLNPDILRDISNTRAKIETLPDEEERERLSKVLDTAELVSDFKSGTHQLSSEELSRLSVDELVPLTGLEDSDLDVSARQAIDRARIQSIQERNEDGAEYVRKHYPNKFLDPDSSIQQQRELGIQNPRVMTKEEASIESQAILEATNPLERANRIDGILERYGQKHGPRALMEMSKENDDFHAGYVFSSYIPRSQTRQKVIESLSRRGDNLKTIKGLPNGQATVNTLKDGIRKSMKEATQAFAKSDLPELGNQMRDMIQAVAMDDMVRNDTETSEAIKKATNQVFNKNFTAIQTESSDIVVPNSIQADTGVVRDFIEDSLKDKDFLKEAGLDPAFFGSRVSEDEFFEFVQEDSYWALSESGDGLVLMATDQRSGQVGIAPTSGGSPVEVKFSEMSSLLEGRLKEQRQERRFEKTSTLRGF